MSAAGFHARVQRLLPKGWRDLGRQILLFCGCYYVYRIVRGQVDDAQAAATAFDNAREIIAIEQALGLFFEPAVNAWAERTGVFADVGSWLYVNSHFAVTTVALGWLYLRRNDSFYFVRNMFMVAMGIALVLYVAYPTAPPRMLPEWGFTDSVARYTGVDPNGSAGVLFNPFAAVPSMHVGFALMLAGAFTRLVRRRWAKALWAAYPLVVTFAVVVTANHWWLDAALGAAVAAVAALAAAGVFARVRPAAWAFRPAPARAAA